MCSVSTDVLYLKRLLEEGVGGIHKAHEQRSRQHKQQLSSAWMHVRGVQSMLDEVDSSGGQLQSVQRGEFRDAGFRYHRAQLAGHFPRLGQSGEREVGRRHRRNVFAWDDTGVS